MSKDGNYVWEKIFCFFPHKLQEGGWTWLNTTYRGYPIYWTGFSEYVTGKYIYSDVPNL